MGEILEIDFPRPRDREAIFSDPKFFAYREHLIAFLEQRAHIKGATRIFSKGETMGYMDKEVIKAIEKNPAMTQLSVVA